jgi:5-methylcytosine-specific restriction endonuclease McrA
MGKWIHRLTEIDVISNTAKCEECGIVRIINKPRNYGKRGWVCQKAKQQRNHKSAKKTGKTKFYRKAYQKHPKPVCISCGFIPEDPCQIDIDHIDGNHKNNNKENLQALCANCHRLKTKKNKEGIYKNTL